MNLGEAHGFLISSGVDVATLIALWRLFRTSQDTVRKEVLSELRALRDSSERADAQLHERVNRVRDEYVSRETHKTDSDRLWTELHGLREDFKQFHRDLMQWLAEQRGGG